MSFRPWWFRALVCGAVALCTAVAACTGDSSQGDASRSDSLGDARVGVRVDAPAVAHDTATAAPADTDDFGAPLPVDARDGARVVSLNPPVTELLFAIGAEDRLVGRSAWDEFPSGVARIASVGDGIRPNVEAVLSVRPTLVVMYATAENRAAAAAFRAAGVRVMALRVDHIADFLALTRRLGIAVGAEARAAIVRDSVQATLDRVRALTANRTRRRVVWPAWLSPTMVIGGGSYIDELVEIAGGRNVFHDVTAPSPAVSIEEIARRDPELLVASAATIAKIKAAPQWNAVAAVRDGRFVVEDPAETGRPSVMLGMAAVSLARAFHPDLAAQLR